MTGSKQKNTQTALALRSLSRWVISDIKSPVVADDDMLAATLEPDRPSVMAPAWDIAAAAGPGPVPDDSSFSRDSPAADWTWINTVLHHFPVHN